MIRVIRKRIIGGGILIGGGVTVVLTLITVIAVVRVNSSEAKWPKFISSSVLGTYKKAAVATTGPECAQIAAGILERNGSAVDAAIAALLCEGVASLHSMGLGGGFFMTIYNSATGEADFLDARESAPALASSKMFDGNASLSLEGGLAVAVPGELKGYWEAYKKYGRLPWKDLFQPSIELCRKGNIITKYLETSLKEKEKYIRNEPTLAEILINPETNKLYVEGERLRRPKLAETLKQLANHANPPELFYNGEIGDKLVKEIQSFGGIITKQDFSNYEVEWRTPIEAKIGKLTMYTAPPPGSGALLVFMMNVLHNFVFEKGENVMWQRIVETFKWAYARRTELGDPIENTEDIKAVIRNLTSQEYADSIKLQIKEDITFNDPEYYGAKTENNKENGTAHISVLAPDGSAVSVTSTINQVLGAKIRSKSTGIIFNDEMDDFSSPNMTNGFGLPPSPTNFIKPGKRPLSSMSPTIMIDENKKVQLVIGAAGGSKITTAIAYILVLHLWNNQNIKEAIDACRIHHQLVPMQIQYEHGFPSEILTYLSNIGHNVTEFSGIGSAVTAISIGKTQVTANSDYRRQGTTAGF